MYITKLYECIKNKKVNNSHAREAIYNVLQKEDTCLSVSDITKRLQESYTKTVSLNTIYRHLTLFTECGLVTVIQDDFKKSYYMLTKDTAHVFTLCPKCNDISTMKDTEELTKILSTLENTEFITIHGNCKNCK